MKGNWILFEGGEGAGKSTQVAMLQEWFSTSLLADRFTGLTVTREPGGTQLGQEIRRMLLHGQDIDPTTELLLFAADRAQHMTEVVRPALERGELVIQDRGFLSTIAYQGYGRKISPRYIDLLNEMAMGDITPDVIIWLNVPPRQATKRGEKQDRIESESLEFHQRVYQGFARYLSEPMLSSSMPIVRIDGTQPPDKVFENVVEVLVTHLFRPESKPQHPKQNPSRSQGDDV